MLYFGALTVSEVSMMKYAVELYFDADTENALNRLARRVAEEGISTRFLEWKTRPHLTLACLNDVDEKIVSERIDSFAARHCQLPALICSVGMFPDTRTIFVSPVMNRSMYGFHRELHEYLCDCDFSGWEWYQPDFWAPHCTIALAREDGEDAFLRASELILHEFRKISGTFSSIGLVRISFPVSEIHTAPLCPST